jgi:hypothetical protein
LKEEKGESMKKVLGIMISLVLIMSVAIAPVYAAGGKNQHEIGAPDAPGPGDDAQGYQAG